MANPVPQNELDRRQLLKAGAASAFLNFLDATFPAVQLVAGASKLFEISVSEHVKGLIESHYLTELYDQLKGSSDIHSNALYRYAMDKLSGVTQIPNLDGPIQNRFTQEKESRLAEATEFVHKQHQRGNPEFIDDLRIGQWLLDGGLFSNRFSTWDDVVRAYPDSYNFSEECVESQINSSINSHVERSMTEWCLQSSEFAPLREVMQSAIGDWRRAIFTMTESRTKAFIRAIRDGYRFDLEQVEHDLSRYIELQARLDFLSRPFEKQVKELGLVWREFSGHRQYEFMDQVQEERLLIEEQFKVLENMARLERGHLSTFET